MTFNNKNQISQKYINKFISFINKTPYGPKNDPILYPMCNEDCWEFLGRIEKDGYGRIEVDQNVSMLAHRLSYIIYTGNIPSGLLVRHLCDIKRCVNPKHLILGTHMDNRNDAVNRNRIPFGENTNATRLKNDDIKQILLDTLNNKYKNVNEICEHYDILPVTLSFVFSGHTWKSVSNEFCKEYNVRLCDIRKKVKDDRFSHVLIEEDVIQIKQQLQLGIAIKQIAKNFLVTTSLIYGIKNNKIWSHIKI